jgi:hypothetical protein
MHETIDWDVDVVASLKMDDIEALRHDPEWTRYVEFIGWGVLAVRFFKTKLHQTQLTGALGCRKKTLHHG